MSEPRVLSLNEVVERVATRLTTSQPRLALKPEEAAEAIGVSRDYFDEHVLPELKVVRRGRRVLVATAELEAWLARSAERSLACRARN